MGVECLPQRVIFGEFVGVRVIDGGKRRTGWLICKRICRYLESNSKGGESLLRSPPDGFDE